MGMTEDFESSLQVLRGFDADISVEVNEIKVTLILLLRLVWLLITNSSELKFELNFWDSSQNLE